MICKLFPGLHWKVVNDGLRSIPFLAFGGLWGTTCALPLSKQFLCKKRRWVVSEWRKTIEERLSSRQAGHIVHDFLSCRPWRTCEITFTYPFSSFPWRCLPSSRRPQPPRLEWSGPFAALFGRADYDTLGSQPRWTSAPAPTRAFLEVPSKFGCYVPLVRNSSTCG